MPEPIVSPWAAILTAVLGGGGLVQAVNMFLGRKGQEVKALGETIQILADQQHRFEEWRKTAELELAVCKKHHQECRDEIARLMAGPVATYPNQPK